jgi:ribosome-associated protein
MKKITIVTTYITLGQFLKYISVISSGAVAKEYLSTNTVYVNDEIEARRGRKLYDGYVIQIDNEKYQIGNES